MKKHLFIPLVLLFFNVFFCYSQSDENSIKNISNTVFYPGSELRITVGIAPLDMNFGGQGCHNSDYYIARNYSSISIGESLTNPSIYFGNYKNTGAYTISYTYRFKKWFELTGNLTYSGVLRSTYYSYNNEAAFSVSSHIITLSPTARFVWLRKKYVTLYSSVSVGLGMIVQQGKYSSNGLAAVININPFGITVGRKVYGFFDISLGSVGLFSAGVGYRFNY